MREIAEAVRTYHDETAQFISQARTHDHLAGTLEQLTNAGAIEAATEVRLLMEISCVDIRARDQLDAWPETKKN